MNDANRVKVALNFRRLALQNKPVDIPELKDDGKPREPPEFIRFYMGKRTFTASKLVTFTGKKIDQIPCSHTRLGTAGHMFLH